MTPAERFLEQVRDTLPCCPNCEHFSTSTVVKVHQNIETTEEYCVRDPQKRRPPAKIIAFGCPAFSQDIPF